MLGKYSPSVSECLPSYFGAVLSFWAYLRVCSLQDPKPCLPGQFSFQGDQAGFRVGSDPWWILAGRTKNCPVQASLSTPLQATLKIQICVWSVLIRMLRSVLTELSILAQLWSIRQLHDFDQAAPWPIRPLPDFDQAAAWPIRQQPEYHIFWFSLI